MGNYESISEQEKTVFLDAWVLIKADLVGYSNAMFNVIFTDYPLMANFFPFTGPEDDRFEQHAAIFIKEMDQWVQNLRNPSAARKLITEMSHNHSKRNIPPEEFDNLRDCFLRAVSTKMGPIRFGREQYTAFFKISTVAFNYIKLTTNRDRVNRWSAR